MTKLRRYSTGFCLWCGGPPDRNKRTIEHFIPKWVVRELPHLSIRPDAANAFTACKACNERRGPMPAALFMSIRDSSPLVLKATVYWHAIAQLVSKLRYKDDLFYDRLRRECEIGFLSLIPESTGLLDPRVGMRRSHVRTAETSLSADEWRHLADNYDAKQMTARAAWFLVPKRGLLESKTPNDFDRWASENDDPDAPRFIRTGGADG